MEENKTLPYPLLKWLEAKEQGRLVIDKRDGKEHRRFSTTLQPTQVAKAFKSCLNKGELDTYKETELLIITKKLIDILGKRRASNYSTINKHYRGRLNTHLKNEIKARRSLDKL